MFTTFQNLIILCSPDIWKSHAGSFIFEDLGVSAYLGDTPLTRESWILSRDVSNQSWKILPPVPIVVLCINNVYL